MIATWWRQDRSRRRFARDALGAPAALAAILLSAAACSALIARFNPADVTPSPRDWALAAAVDPTTVVPRAAVAPPSVSQPQEPVKFYVVQASFNGEREFLFEIAQRFLGDGNRFSEIFELNQGRLQPDGLRLTDPAVIEPGWILRLPSDAEGDGVQFGPLPVVSVPAVPADGSDAGAGPQSAGQPAARSWPRWMLPGAVIVGVLLLALVATLLIRWRRSLAVADAASTATKPTRPVGGSTAGSTGVAPTPRAPRRFDMLRLFRRPRGVDVAYHVDTAASWTVDRALRVLATACAAEGRSYPEFYAITVDDERMTLRLATPTGAPPAPWHATTDALAWRAPLRELQGLPIDPTVHTPVRRLVTLGTADRSRVLLDLARCTGIIGMTGDPARIRALVAAWVTELTRSPWSSAAEIRVVLAGFRDVSVPAGAEDRVIIVPGPGTVPAAMWPPADPAAQADDERPPSPGGVVILDRPPRARDAEHIRRLLAGEEPGWSVIVLDAGDEARWSLALAADGRIDTGVLGVDVRTPAASSGVPG